MWLTTYYCCESATTCYSVLVIGLFFGLVPEGSNQHGPHTQTKTWTNTP